MHPGQIRKLEVLRRDLTAHGFDDYDISKAIGVAASKFNPPVPTDEVNAYLKDHGLPQLPDKTWLYYKAFWLL